ncbi:hypothetical protein INR49_023586, partial [Caranx melampygus]
MTLTSQAPRFKSKYITAELARLFSQSDSEEEFEGFSEDEDEECRRNSNKRMKTKMEDSEEDSDVDTGFYSDGETASHQEEKSFSSPEVPHEKTVYSKSETAGGKCQKTCERTPSSKRARGRPSVKQRQDEEEEEEEEEEQQEDKEEVLYQSLKKRDKNIQENKAMLAKLFADLSTMADMTLPTTPQKKKKKQTPEKAMQRKRKSEPEMGQKGGTRLVDDEHVGEKKRKRRSSKWNQYVRSVDDITKEELDNIAYRSKDKIWDKENGSSCHQCRQKTLDTKTVCRSGFCVGAKGQFCGLCLRNRYGEDVRTVLLDPTWSCPICRGMCNCSLCRKKEGRCATGILVGLARYNGHDNVHEYLERYLRGTAMSEVIRGGGCSRVRVTRESRHGNYLRGGAQAFGGVFLHVISGDDCHRGSPLLVLTSNGEGNTLHLNPSGAQSCDADRLYPRPWVDLGCAQRQGSSAQGDQPSAPHCSPTSHRGQCQLLWHGRPQAALQGDSTRQLQCLPGLDGLEGLSRGQLEGLNVLRLLLALGLSLTLSLGLQLDLLDQLVPHLAHDHLLYGSCCICLVLQSVGLGLALRICFTALHLGGLQLQRERLRGADLQRNRLIGCTCQDGLLVGWLKDGLGLTWARGLDELNLLRQSSNGGRLSGADMDLLRRRGNDLPAVPCELSRDQFQLLGHQCLTPSCVHHYLTLELTCLQLDLSGLDLDLLGPCLGLGPSTPPCPPILLQ